MTTAQRYDLAYAPTPEPPAPEPIALDALRVTVRTRGVWAGNMIDTAASGWVTDGTYAIHVLPMGVKRTAQFTATTQGSRQAPADAVDKIIAKSRSPHYDMPAHILPLVFSMSNHLKERWYATYLQGNDGQIVTVSAQRLAMVTRSLGKNYDKITITGAQTPVLFWWGDSVVALLMPVYMLPTNAENNANIERALSA